jgi:16S rRNA processing protein RimM
LSLELSTDTPESPPEVRYDTLVGGIIGAHGVQGAVKLRLATPTADALISVPKQANDQDTRPFTTVWVGSSPEDGKLYRVYSAKRQAPKDILLVRLADVGTRHSAGELVGFKVYAPEDRRTPLGADEYFVDDLIGLDVITEGGTGLGKLTQVLSEPGNDVYETDAGALIPAVKAFIVGVDLASRRLIVRDTPGLLPIER